MLCICNVLNHALHLGLKTNWQAIVISKYKTNNQRVKKFYKLLN
ncbi:hypothetical protein PESP_a1907 [Pseudoalteromonas espejiana DSM 9414]|nr:hypothetical protein PESP_a1907 [Pseudoalteromonas espejiana DSM 9414]